MNCTPSCNCKGCVALRICRAIDPTETLLNKVYAPLVVHPSSDPVVLRSAMIVSLDYQLNLMIERDMLANQDPHERVVQAKLWTEWHLEPWSRNGEPEPIPEWAKGVTE